MKAKVTTTKRISCGVLTANYFVEANEIEVWLQLPSTSVPVHLGRFPFAKFVDLHADILVVHQVVLGTEKP